jgi:Flp pilus assembly protein TadB
MGGSGRGEAIMSVVAAGARPIRGKAFPKTKGTLVVVAVALLALLVFAAFMIPASQAKNAEHSYSSAARSTPDRSGAAAPGSSEPQAAPQMSKKEALQQRSKALTWLRTWTRLPSITF